MELPRYKIPNLARKIPQLNVERLKCNACNCVTYYGGIVLVIIALPLIVIAVIVWFSKGDID